MKRIPVTGRAGVVAHALVDDEDAPLVESWAWNLKTGGYAGRYDSVRRLNLRMHRVILGVTDPAQHVDHINGNGLDNRRANLRVCTPGENAQNRQGGYGRSSYRGVYWAKGAWIAQVTVDGDKRYLGRYADEKEAAAVAAAHRAAHMPASLEARQFGEREQAKEAAA